MMGWFSVPRKLEEDWRAPRVSQGREDFSLKNLPGHRMLKETPWLSGTHYTLFFCDKPLVSREGWRVWWISRHHYLSSSLRGNPLDFREGWSVWSISRHNCLKSSLRGPFIMREIEGKILVEGERVFLLWFLAIGIPSLVQYLGFSCTWRAGPASSFFLTPTANSFSLLLATYIISVSGRGR